MTKLCSQVWVHAVWATKNRMPLIDSTFETQLYKFISNQFYELGCVAKIVNGALDHIHCLFLMNKTKSIAHVIKHVKGSSSFFINQSNFTDDYFIWQRGYATYAVSEWELNKIYNYIKNQKEQHRLDNHKLNYSYIRCWFTPAPDEVEKNINHQQVWV